MSWRSGLNKTTVRMVLRSVRKDRDELVVERKCSMCGNNIYDPTDHDVDCVGFALDTVVELYQSSLDSFVEPRPETEE